MCLVIFVINIALFSSSAGYYWLETVDHYATSINLVVFLFFQLIVMVYMLPISDLAKKVGQFGEEFPQMYLIPLKIVCPFFALFLAVMAVTNEYWNPKVGEELSEKIVSYSIMAAPLVSMIIISIWNPFGREGLVNKADRRSANLLGENAEYEDYDD